MISNLRMIYLQLIIGIVFYSAVRAEFAPPVNNPNDCRQCFAAPCPCGTTCPQLSCDTDCQVWRLDSRGCNTCQCAPPVNNPNDCNRCITTPCPCGRACPERQSCDKNCEVWKKDSRGCNICQCECRKLKCLPCDFGFVYDAEGCQTCECRTEPCAAPFCLDSCSGDRQRDSTGCETCNCVSEDKVGTCPAVSDGREPCKADCSTDQDCPGSQKCCGDCHRKCMEPMPVVKPGTCPTSAEGTFGICVVLCQDDSKCPGDQKCCGSCPRECKTPDYPPATDSLRCPARLTRPRRKCRRQRQDRCSTDQDCAPGRLCCGFCFKRCVRGRPALNSL